jgi:hypothetical protein
LPKLFSPSLSLSRRGAKRKTPTRANTEREKLFPSPEKFFFSTLSTRSLLPPSPSAFRRSFLRQKFLWQLFSFSLSVSTSCLLSVFSNNCLVKFSSETDEEEQQQKMENYFNSEKLSFWGCQRKFCHPSYLKL